MSHVCLWCGEEGIQVLLHTGESGTHDLPQSHDPPQSHAPVGVRHASRGQQRLPGSFPRGVRGGCK